MSVDPKSSYYDEGGIADQFGEVAASADLSLFDGEEVVRMWPCGAHLHILTSLDILYIAEFDGESITITCEEEEH